MHADRWPRFKQLLASALELEHDARATFVRGLAAGDRDLADELERWLALEPRIEGFLDEPIEIEEPAAASSRLALGPDGRIGRYKILAVLGFGGSGVVLEAEQDAPRRKVALKVLQRGLHSPVALRRFFDEANALALLDHPGVARVLEAGTLAQDGVDLPFIAIELVEGARDLISHARAAKAPRAERLRLFVELCAAVGEGHARGVIHRDLKPANVLVDRAGRVKVIDFGIARMLGEPGASRLTAQGDQLGTLAYMSPEQARGDVGAIDTRSDVYSLGVLLHQLLLDALPSAGTVPRPRDVDPRFPRDLDAVLARALAEAPSRRYPTAHELGADVRRFLDHRPVEARAPSFWRHAGLLARRHRTGLALSLLAVAIGATALFAVAGRERSIEQRERAKARQITDFVAALLEHARPSLTARGDVRLSDVLAEAAATLDRDLPDAREARAELHATIGIALRELGELDLAVEHVASALELRRADSESGHRLAVWHNMLGDVLVSAGRGEEAERVLREAEALEHGDPQTPAVFVGITSNHLARALLAQGKHDPAAESASRAHAIYSSELGPRHEAVAAAERTLGDVARARCDWAGAEQRYAAARSIHAEVHGESSLQVAQDRLRLGEMQLEAGRREQARESLEAAKRRLDELLPREHPDAAKLAALLADLAG